MSSNGTIDWHPIASLPEECRDGRDMLLWNGATAEVGNWTDETFEGRPGWQDNGEQLPIEHVTHWANINEPGEASSEPADLEMRTV